MVNDDITNICQILLNYENLLLRECANINLTPQERLITSGKIKALNDIAVLIRDYVEKKDVTLSDEYNQWLETA